MTGSGKRNNSKDFDVRRFRTALLKWYDKHRRVMPWRALPGQKADPYHVWLSEIMLQQTTVPTVGPYFLKFLKKWPSVHDLAKAPQEDVLAAWAGLGYYARARNLHKCAKTVSEEYKGVFPKDEEALQSLPGIGPYTSAAIRAIAFDKPATVVDGNIERVMARIFRVKEPLPASKQKLVSCAQSVSEGQKNRPGDFAQSLMDLGSAICTPTSPKCNFCPIMSFCEAKKQGVEEALPARQKKAQKPKKYGYVYWIENPQGAVLFERRPEKGLFGGMVGLPGSDWSVDKKGLRHIAIIQKQKKREALPEKVLHSFTHFDLELTIEKTRLSAAKARRYTHWVSREEIGGLGLPTLFRKTVKLMK